MSKVRSIHFRLSKDDHDRVMLYMSKTHQTASSYLRKHLLDLITGAIEVRPAKPVTVGGANPMGLTDNKPMDKSVNPLNPAWKKGQTREVPRMANGDPDTEEFLPMMRGMARRGASRSDIAREFGVSTDFLEYTCLYHAKHCRTHPVMPWHTEREEARLISAQTDAKYAALTFNHSPDTPALPPSMTPAAHTHTPPLPRFNYTGPEPDDIFDDTPYTSTDTSTPNPDDADPSDTDFST